MKLLLCYSPAPRVVVQEPLELPAGSSAAQALALSHTLAQHPHMQSATSQVRLGLWGRRCGLSQVLQEGDRLELYRPLKVEPKVARRERYQKQGPGVAGRFAKLRPGAKQGY